MYIDKGSGLEVYEKIEDFLDKTITEAYDYSDKYYFTIKSKDNYDNRIWIIDKKTKKVSNMFYTEFIATIEDDTKLMNPEKMKEALSK